MNIAIPIPNPPDLVEVTLWEDLAFTLSKRFFFLNIKYVTYIVMELTINVDAIIKIIFSIKTLISRILS